MDQQHLTDDTADLTESELVELGSVSEETKGGTMGWPDGGNARCIC